MGFLNDLPDRFVVAWPSRNVHWNDHLRVLAYLARECVRTYVEIVPHIHHYRSSSNVHHRQSSRRVCIGRYDYFVARTNTIPAKRKQQTRRRRITTRHSTKTCQLA